MEEAIKRAIEGGYKNEKSNCRRCGLRRREANGLMPGCRNNKNIPYKSHLFRRPTNRFEVYLLDPLFWQALTIGCGWDVKEGTMRCENYNPKYHDPGERGCNADKCEYAGYRDWKMIWHRFVDHLASGGTPDKFFEGLLTK